MSSSKKLSLSKILKFASENGFNAKKIYKIRGSIRFIIFDAENDEILVVEVPSRYTVIDKGGVSKTLKSSDANNNHEDYWSLLSSALTDNNLICCGSENITVFKNNGEIYSFTLSLEDKLGESDEEDSDEEDGDEHHNVVTGIEKEVENIVSKNPKDSEEKQPSTDGNNDTEIDIVFLDDEGKQLSDEELKKEKKVVISFEENGKGDEMDIDVLKEKLQEIYNLEDTIDLDLGNFYLLVSLTDFHKDIEDIKNKLKRFYTVLKEEEGNIRSSRLDNIVITISSLHQTIRNCFDWYVKEEKIAKDKLHKLLELYEKIKDVKGKSDEKKLEINTVRDKLKNMISKERQNVCTIRDLLYTLLNKLEGDMEKISQRCSIPTLSSQDIEV